MAAQEIIEQIISDFAYQKLEILWLKTLDWDMYDFPESISLNYKFRTELFCTILESTLKKDLARLFNNGSFLEGKPSELAQVFRQSFPSSEIEWDSNWWYLDDCPASIVWYADNDNGGILTSPVGDGRYYYWP